MDRQDLGHDWKWCARAVALGSRVRAMLVEMVWCMIRWQPEYRALRKWRPVPGDAKGSAAARKKAVVEGGAAISPLILNCVTSIYPCFQPQIWQSEVMTLEELKEEANMLSDEQKGRFASDLLASMTPPSYDVSDEEVMERSRQLESGEVEDISFGELNKRLGR